MSQPNTEYRITLADLVNIADAATELDEARRFYVDQPDEQKRLAQRVEQLHDMVERAAGAHSVVIYGPDYARGFLDYDRVKAFFADKLASDFAGRGRFESAFFHTVQMCYEQGLRDGGAHNATDKGRD